MVEDSPAAIELADEALQLAGSNQPAEAAKRTSLSSPNRIGRMRNTCYFIF
jgi:hypothetical protein